MTFDLKALNRMLEELAPTMERGNDTAASAPGEITQKTVGDGLSGSPYGEQFNFLSADDSLYMQRKLNRLTWEEKGYILQKQLAAGSGRGIPLQHYQAAQMAQAAESMGNTFVAKALDTAGGAALIRQDLDPMLVS